MTPNTFFIIGIAFPEYTVEAISIGPYMSFIEAAHIAMDELETVFCLNNYDWLKPGDQIITTINEMALINGKLELICKRSTDIQIWKKHLI